MYPEDQQPQPPNQNQMGSAPRPFDYGHPLQSRKTKPGETWLPWAISGFLMLLVIVIGVIFTLSQRKNNNQATNGSSSSSQSSANAASSGCNDKQRRYQNQNLNIRFCYPTSWGDVAVANGQFDPSDSGTRYMLTFSAKPAVHLGLASDDWSTDTGKTPSCLSPSIQAFPDVTNFSAKWVTQPAASVVVSAVRGLEVVPDSYLLQEEVNSTALKGVCLEGYMAIGGDVYSNAEATLFAAFAGKITTPQMHIASPTQLVSVTDRIDFTSFVKSIEKY